MNELFASSAMLGAALSIIAFQIGLYFRRKFDYPLVNPMIIAVTIIIVLLQFLNVEYESYNESAKYITYFLTPTTVSLAIPLYEQIQILKKHKKAILAGVLAGVVSNLLCIFGLSLLFGLSHVEYVTLLPKSITTAIAISLTEEFGGVVTITIVAITISGLLGNMFAEQACKWFRIQSPISQGIAIGTASHAMGTSKAMEMGEIQGAMGGLAIVVAGIMTTIGASIFANFI